ncbi:MAG: phosphoenolpyruvate hydrolase family protein [Pseudomonadales bacterium]|nr:phosphoenolpyruvate hydrolase family protein [Pseudomonadales bacterium]
MKPENRTKILKRFRDMIGNGQPIVGGGAGTGISAKSAEAGGADLLIIYNSGRYRMAGRSSLSGYMAFGNANEIVMDMAKEVLPVVQHTPVLAGVNATDPFIDIERFLQQIKDTGFAGVQNFPTIGLIDGQFRLNLEETGINYASEVEMIRLAVGMDLLTTPYIFNQQEAEQMAEAGADIIVIHFGLTTGGSIGASTAKSLAQCAAEFNLWSEAILQIKSDTIIICHGGPLSQPDDALYMLNNCPNCHGFYGASSMERLPTEIAIRDQTEAFKQMRR